MDFSISSSVFKDREPIPAKYTCNGQNISPPLRWEGAPENTESFVLIVDDPDAPAKTWVHWVVYNIPKAVRDCGEGSVPGNGLQGLTDFGEIGYGGPCPPSGIHRYFFKLYALDQTLDLKEGATKEQVEKAMKSHILKEAQIIGTYSQKG